MSADLKLESEDRVLFVRGTLIFAISSLAAALGLAVIFSPLLAAGFFVFSLLLLVFFYDIRIGLLALVLSSAFAAAVSPLFSFRFAHFHFSHLLSILLVIVFAIQALRRKDRLLRRETNIDTPLVLLFLISLLSVLNSYLFWDSAVSFAHRHLIVQVTGIVLILFSISVFMIIVRRIRSWFWVKILYYALIAVNFMAALLSIVLKYSGIRLFNPEEVNLDLGILYTVGFSLVFAGFLFAKTFVHRLAWFFVGGAVLLDIAAFNFYGERTLIAIASSALIIAFLRSKKLFVLFLLLLVLIVAVKSGRIQDLIFSPDESFHYRLILWKDTLNVLMQHWSYWLVGVGPGNYYAYSLVYTFNATDQGAWGLTTPHSQYFMVLGELGFAGLFFFLWFLMNALRTQFSLFSKTKDSFSQSLSAGSVGAFIGMVFLCIFADSLIPSVSNLGFDRICTSIYPWILLGIVYCTARMTEAERMETYV
jgi:hypothetical protein